MLCPCQSERIYTECCQPIIEQDEIARSPEDLMRSRYTAYYLKHIDYLYQTQAPETRTEHLYAEIEAFANAVQFINLSVLSSQIMTEHQGQVEFIAKYIDHHDLITMRECSDFIKIDQLWYYTSGDVRFEKTKINRNQLCVCGSGKKYKRCCG